MEETCIVIPCYNEAGRLTLDQYNELISRDGVSLLFVNDGSKDDTRRELEAYVGQTGGRALLLNLEVNSGKAEAVRRGLGEAISQGATLTGFLDADMATPAYEALRLLEVARENKYAVVLGSRVKLLGTKIARRPVRHYFGRIFATAASLILRLPVYDTQCGAKFFSVTPLFRDILSEPFTTRWFFDVEMIGRLMIGTKTSPPLTIHDFIEVPLQEWVDVRGSKITSSDVLKVPLELLKIARHLNARRKMLRS